MQYHFLIIPIVALGMMLAAYSDNNAALDTIRQQGELVVLTRNAPTTRYEGRDGPSGPEHDLVTQFARQHNLKVRFKIFNSTDDIITAINAGEGHIAAAGLTYTEDRNDDGFIFGPEYQEVQQQVVCRRNNGSLPKSPDDLIDLKITVIENSSYQETLNSLKADYPKLQWQTVTDLDTEQLLEQVWRKKIDCTLADSTIVSISRRYHPELIVAFTIGEPQAMSWMLAPQWKNLNSTLETWFEQIEENGFLATVHERYYGHVEIFDYVDVRAFMRRIKKRLPQYIETFQTAGKQHNIPWTLLAAQAYQESHWRANAKSPTGVRGIMMLTLNTAKAVGVKSRLNAIQSINGGAKYLNKMIKRIPDSVKNENRLWYALAAYNVGYGHLNDARKLTAKLGKNPDLWVDLKEVLPLLSQKKYYSELKHGYARGTEPVLYVQRIRNYRQLLEETLKQKLANK
ncbi:MAG: membrane-bound lytic murein transglycosylase MltF [Gammaproteobacteria bacterium]|nr:membrane-bound lytic murein transglycosylase MltF [Gammaproteobacteria bacterium]MCW9003826.1 membrane-bound lytic murein transglycosylase MltF [Gammaproteobacteria bacterium]MCW9056215.1 membrane-bound lytic murein transglycosylase MltF [Gammaproteobacteria bacterium]